MNWPTSSIFLTVLLVIALILVILKLVGVEVNLNT